MKENDEKYLTYAPKEEMVTIETGGIFPNLKHAAGDSVDEHDQPESASGIRGAGAGGAG